MRNMNIEVYLTYAIQETTRGTAHFAGIADYWGLSFISPLLLKCLHGEKKKGLVECMHVFLTLVTEVVEFKENTRQHNTDDYSVWRAQVLNIPFFKNIFKE